MSSAICFNLNQSKILSSGNGLNLRAPFITIIAFVANVDQYHDAQNLQTDL